MTWSSMDSRDLASTPSVELFSHLVEKNACEHEQEGHCNISFSKDLIANSVSAETYMLELEEDGTQTVSDCCRRSSLMGEKELSSLKETDVSKISRKELSDNGATLGHCCDKEKSLKGQLSGPMSVNDKKLLVRHPITVAEDKVSAVSPFLELDNMR